MNQATSASPKAAAAEETNVEEVALFPIPDLVAFPGTVIPLHVFEPRYRKMVHDCVCLLYTSPSPRDRQKSRMPSSA